MISPHANSVAPSGIYVDQCRSTIITITTIDIIDIQKFITYQSSTPINCQDFSENYRHNPPPEAEKQHPAGRRLHPGRSKDQHSGAPQLLGAAALPEAELRHQHLPENGDGELCVSRSIYVYIIYLYIIHIYILFIYIYIIYILYYIYTHTQTLPESRFLEENQVL